MDEFGTKIYRTGQEAESAAVLGPARIDQKPTVAPPDSLDARMAFYWAVLQPFRQCPLWR
jgi:hypothetical protein